jgi:hypothetical protein
MPDGRTTICCGFQFVKMMPLMTFLKQRPCLTIGPSLFENESMSSAQVCGEMLVRAAVAGVGGNTAGGTSTPLLALQQEEAAPRRSPENALPWNSMHSPPPALTALPCKQPNPRSMQVPGVSVESSLVHAGEALVPLQKDMILDLQRKTSPQSHQGVFYVPKEKERNV